MSWKYNIFTRKPDYYEKNTGSGGSKITNLSLVFCESFVGNGVDTVFTLTGAITNASFQTGSWSLPRVEVTLPKHATTDEGKALYDKTNWFTRNRVQVQSINGATGEVTLTYPPKAGDFCIWYWYTLQSVDVLSTYVRPDFVASMEHDLSYGNIIAENVAVNTVNFDQILSASDTTVQRALDTLDDHTHAGLPIDPDTHRTLDQLVHDLDENHHQEYTYSGWRIDSIVVWDSPSKNVKIREFFYTYNGIRVVTEVINQYDGTGTLVETLTYSYTYTGPRITSVDCVRST